MPQNHVAVILIESITEYLACALCVGSQLRHSAEGLNPLIGIAAPPLNQINNVNVCSPSDLQYKAD